MSRSIKEGGRLPEKSERANPPAIKVSSIFNTFSTRKINVKSVELQILRKSFLHAPKDECTDSKMGEIFMMNLFAKCHENDKGYGRQKGYEVAQDIVTEAQE